MILHRDRMVKPIIDKMLNILPGYKCNFFNNLPVVPTYGGFHVKLTTCIGKPISFDESIDAESLAKIAKQRLETLIDTHQPKPTQPAILRALKNVSWNQVLGLCSLNQ